MNLQSYLTKKELSVRFRTSVSWVDKAMAYEPEKLPAYIKFGRLVRFPIAEVLKFEQTQLTNKQ
jgi:predicted DNA-binding transcriptional regulator AlpA